MIFDFEEIRNYMEALKFIFPFIRLLITDYYQIPVLGLHNFGGLISTVAIQLSRTFTNLLALSGNFPHSTGISLG